MSRKEITAATPTNDVFSQLTFVVSALAIAGEDGDRAVGALAPGIEKVLGEGEVLHSEQRGRARAIEHASALCRRRSDQADESVRGVSNAVLADRKFDRSDPIYGRLFPDPPSAMAPLGLASKVEVLQRLKGRVADPQTPATLRKDQGKAIDHEIARGEAALKVRDEAQHGKESTAARIGAWRDDANAALLGVEGALQSLAATRRLGKRWVASFFPASEKRRKARSAPPVVTKLAA